MFNITNPANEFLKTMSKLKDMHASQKSLKEFIEMYGNKLTEAQLSDLKTLDSVFSSSTLEAHEGNREYSTFKFKLTSCSGIGMNTEITIFT